MSRKIIMLSLAIFLISKISLALNRFQITYSNPKYYNIEDMKKSNVVCYLNDIFDNDNLWDNIGDWKGSACLSEGQDISFSGISDEVSIRTHYRKISFSFYNVFNNINNKLEQPKQHTLTLVNPIINIPYIMIDDQECTLAEDFTRNYDIRVEFTYDAKQNYQKKVIVTQLINELPYPRCWFIFPES